MKNQRPFSYWAFAATCGALALGLAIGAAEPQRAPPKGPAQLAPITATDSREWWLTIVVDPGANPQEVSAANAMLLTAPAELSASPRFEHASCAGWIVWVPIQVTSPWSEIDKSATKVAAVKMGRQGTIDAIPYQIADSVGPVKQWYWGPDRKGPEGASDWRMLVCGPPCDCCDPNCKLETNLEVPRRGFGIELHARSSQPQLNWNAAAALPWVEPGATESEFLKPAPYIESDSVAVRSFAQHWVGTQPRAKSPWLTALALAKGAAARSTPAARVGITDVGGSSNSDPGTPAAAVRGLNVTGAAAFAQRGTGNANDANCLAVAAMRASGIPARVVVGWQVYEQPGTFTQMAELAMWGEFWIGGMGWVPFDCAEMRAQAGGNPTADSAIDGFGAPKNHNRRIAWSWWLDPPFARACDRDFPAGFATGPYYDTKEEMIADIGAMYSDPQKLENAWKAHPAFRALAEAKGVVAATARSNRNTQAMWPGYAGYTRKNHQAQR